MLPARPIIGEYPHPPRYPGTKDLPRNLAKAQKKKDFGEITITARQSRVASKSLKLRELQRGSLMAKRFWPSDHGSPTSDVKERNSEAACGRTSPDSSMSSEEREMGHEW